MRTDTSSAEFLTSHLPSSQQPFFAEASGCGPILQGTQNRLLQAAYLRARLWNIARSLAVAARKRIRLWSALLVNSDSVEPLL